MPLELCRIQRTWLCLAALFLRPIWDPVSAPAALRRRQAWTWDQVFLQLYGQLLALSDSWATPGFLLKEHVGQGRIMTIKKKGPIKMLSTEIVSICCLTGCPFLLIILFVDLSCVIICVQEGRPDASSTVGSSTCREVLQESQKSPPHVRSLQSAAVSGSGSEHRTLSEK